MAKARNGNLQIAILDEARALLVRDGYATLSMRRIAQAIGCTPTSIYLYFRDKDDLIHALIDEGMQRLTRTLQDALAQDSEPTGRLRRVCRGYLEFGLANPEYYEVMFLLHPKHMARYPADKYRRARKNLEAIAEGLAAALGLPPSRAPELLVQATAVWSSLHGAVSLWNAGRIDARVPRKTLIDEAVELATAGVLARLEPNRIRPT
jgi:AcrR family transcriptional regulator